MSSFVRLISYKVNLNWCSMEVLVFKTTVDNLESVQKLSTRLDSLVGQGRWNFALEDCDRILRIVSTAIRPETAIKLLTDYGFECCELPD